MLSGRRLDLLDPSPLDIEIEDIAHGLSRVARWNGQTAGRWAYTVAQHSLLVEQLLTDIEPQAPDRLRLAALLHDAPEYVIGDLITPFKNTIGIDYRTVEQKLAAAIHIRFGLPPVLTPGSSTLIKVADRAAAYWEAIALAGFEVAEADRIFERPSRYRRPQIEPLPPDEARDCFIAKFTKLQSAVDRSSDNRG